MRKINSKKAEGIIFQKSNRLSDWLVYALLTAGVCTYFINLWLLL